MSKVFKFYYDLMSQPSRTLWIALRMGNVNYEDCPVALRKREQLSPEFKKINRFQKVPCIVDGDFHLAESVAILRYLSDKGQFNDKLYPKELQQRARIDEFLEWQHLTLRYGCSYFFMNSWLLPMNGLAPMPSDERLAKLRKEMENNLKLFEKIFLKNSTYITDKLTIADLHAACEIEQLKLTKYDVSEKFPKIGEWIGRVREDTNPYYDEAHTFIYKKSGFKPAK